MIWSIAVADYFPTNIHLFIVGIILYRYIKLKKFCAFLLWSSGTLMLKSRARMMFFRFLLFIENSYLQNCLLIFMCPLGSL